MQMYTEYLGIDECIYSVHHCDLYTITFVQDSTGQLVSFNCETDEELREG
jgi:hypothetical protein